MHLEEVALRLDQAVCRAAQDTSVLQPAIDRLAQVRVRLAVLRSRLGQYWRDGQAHRWE